LKVKLYYPRKNVKKLIALIKFAKRDYWHYSITSALHLRITSQYSSDFPAKSICTGE